MIEIIEILDRAKDGVTEPFICRGDDDNIYFVKGQGIGIKSLVYEWVAGQIARKINLPIAPFALVNVAQDLIDYGLRDDLHELKAGIAFGSQKQSGEWIKYSDIAKITPALQQDLLMFDYWLKNGDRLLTEKGGNPNLLWNPVNDTLIVIDHNNAFDTSFTKNDFLQCHIFKNQWQIISENLTSRRNYEEKFNHILLSWEDIIETIPDQWVLPDDFDSPAEYDLNEMANMLHQHQERNFWNAE